MFFNGCDMPKIFLNKSASMKKKSSDAVWVYVIGTSKLFVVIGCAKWIIPSAWLDSKICFEFFVLLKKFSSCYEGQFGTFNV